MLEVCREYIRSTRAKLSPAYLILTLVTSGPIVISLLLLSSRSLFRTKKLVKCLPKLYLFTTWSDITFLDFVGMSAKLASCS